MQTEQLTSGGTMADAGPRLEIRELTPVRLADVEAVTAFTHALVAVDAPWVHPMPTRMRAVYMERGWDGEPPRVYVGEEYGRVVAVGQLELPERDNRHLAWAEVMVLPRERRRGLGTQMFEHLLQVARAAGRTSVGIAGWESQAATDFAARHGLERKSQAIQRRLHPQELDPSRIEALVALATAASAGYEVVRVAGATPEELVNEVVEITAAINDAPLDDLDIEDEVFTVDRLRDYERSNLESGRLYAVYARHVATGALAGKTVVHVEYERSGIGHQHDTSVVKEHRGHRLGLLLKASMLQGLAEAEPQLEEIDTWNAESNDHMIGVNEQLGCIVMGRLLEFQRDL